MMTCGAWQLDILPSACVVSAASIYDVVLYCGPVGQGDSRGFTAKVSDFGLSKLVVDTVGTTAAHNSSEASGTVTHMAPETLSEGKASPAADVYAFGILSEAPCQPLVPSLVSLDRPEHPPGKASLLDQPLCSLDAALLSCTLACMSCPAPKKACSKTSGHAFKAAHPTPGRACAFVEGMGGCNHTDSPEPVRPLSVVGLTHPSWQAAETL